MFTYPIHDQWTSEKPTEGGDYWVLFPSDRVKLCAISTDEGGRLFIEFAVNGKVGPSLLRAGYHECMWQGPIRHAPLPKPLSFMEAERLKKEVHSLKEQLNRLQKTLAWNVHPPIEEAERLKKEVRYLKEQLNRQPKPLTWSASQPNKDGLYWVIPRPGALFSAVHVWFEDGVFMAREAGTINMPFQVAACPRYQWMGPLPNPGEVSVEKK